MYDAAHECVLVCLCVYMCVCAVHVSLCVHVLCTCVCMCVCICIDGGVSSGTCFLIGHFHWGNQRLCECTGPFHTSLTKWLSICDVTIKPIQDGGDEVKQSWDLLVA